MPQEVWLAFRHKPSLVAGVTITTDEANLLRWQHKDVNFASACSTPLADAFKKKFKHDGALVENFSAPLNVFGPVCSAKDDLCEVRKQNAVSRRMRQL